MRGDCELSPGKCARLRRGRGAPGTGNVGQDGVCTPTPRELPEAECSSPARGPGRRAAVVLSALEDARRPWVFSKPAGLLQGGGTAPHLYSGCLAREGARPRSPRPPSSAVYYFDDPPDKPDAEMLTGSRGGPRLLAFSRCCMRVHVPCMCSNLEARTGLLNCGHRTLIVFMRRGPNVSCRLPGSVKLEAACQRSRVHWLGTRMPWRDYNFSKRRDLAAESRFSLLSKFARSGVGGRTGNGCFRVVKPDSEGDRVWACFIVRHTAARTFP